MEFSNQQRKAIDSRNKNVVVSASAGAGKTTVLVERLTRRIIDDGVDVDRILATTFTEAAAGDIKKKLTRSLRDAYQKSQDARLKRQIALLADADISTLHSFCLKIIKKYYYVIGLDVSITNNIFDETSTNYFKSAALFRTFDAAYQTNSPAFIELLDRQSSSITATVMLEESIKKLATAALSHYDYEGWLKKSASRYKSYSSLSELPEEILDLFYQRLNDFYEIYRNLLKEALLAYADEGKEEPLVPLQLKIQHLEQQVKPCLENRDYMAFRKAIAENADINVRKPTKCTGSDLLNKAYDTYAKALKYLFTETVFLKDLKDNEAVAQELVSLTLNYLKEYRQLKAEAKGIEFDDMERYALDILKADNGSIAKALREHYIDILVDEFQDTNYVQHEIINLIAKENNVFRVGDVKQSIYRFRNAKPAIMQSLITSPGEYDEILYLNQNYRSSGALITFNNDLFTRLMNLEHRPVYFPKNDLVSPGTEEQKQESYPVEFLMVTQTKEEDDSMMPGEKKASRIAEKILELKKQDPTLSYKDFAVLVNANRNKILIQNVLSSYGIPSFGGESLGLYQSSGVKAILSFLEYMEDPSNRIALNSVLVTFFRYDDEKLLAVYQNGLKETDPETYNTIWRIAKSNLTLGDTVNALLRLNHYYEDFNDDNQKANIDLFLDVVDRRDKEGVTVERFLDFINSAVDDNAAEASLSNDDADAVKIMSIHHSKGLEFPVVFLFSKDRTSVSRADSYAFIHSDYGFSIPSLQYPKKYKRENVISLALKYQDQVEEIEESIRVLYVALTRAKHRLYIVDVRDPEKKEDPFTFGSLFSNSYTSWMMALHEDCHYQTVSFKGIEEKDITELLQKEEKKFIYPRYGKQVDEIETLSPSSTEASRADLTLRFEKNTAAQIGTDVHEVFELLPDTIWSKEEILSHLRDDLKHYLPAFEAFRDSDLYHKMLSGTIYKELPFLTKIDGKIIHGYIDMCSITDTEVIVVDFKTDRNVTAEDLIERYTSQIKLYKDSMKTLCPDKAVSGYIYSVTLKQFIAL
ncbi:MAG: UvrD-helicase domain-containing protein [Erysipelotrichaceae bacterium]|nr:UvrD-helicase domain-containing protein [Erysipelotrichaceae bacterium]